MLVLDCSKNNLSSLSRARFIDLRVLAIPAFEFLGSERQLPQPATIILLLGLLYFFFNNEFLDTGIFRLHQNAQVRNFRAQDVR